MFFQRLWSKGFAAHHVEGIVPQNYRLNRGAWKTMENEWADWLTKYRPRSGSKVEIDVIPPGADVPDKFIVRYKIYEVDSNGNRVLIKSRKKEFKNQSDEVFDRVYFRDDGTAE